MHCKLLSSSVSVNQINVYSVPMHYAQLLHIVNRRIQVLQMLLHSFFPNKEEII